MTTRELDQLHEKLDKLDEKLDNIIDMLRDHHGRLSKLESVAGFAKTGAVIVLPLIIKMIYDIAKTL